MGDWLSGLLSCKRLEQFINKRMKWTHKDGSTEIIKLDNWEVCWGEGWVGGNNLTGGQEVELNEPVLKDSKSDRWISLKYAELNYVSFRNFDPRIK